MATLTTKDASPNLLRFLDLTAWSEGTSISPLTKCDGYDVIVSGIYGAAVFEDFSDHPFAKGRAPQIVRSNPLLRSTASGRYQLMLHWWLAYKEELKLTDFSPRSQDLVAVQQIRERNALKLIDGGNFAQAITACSNLWASFPGNSYGQAGGHTMVALLGRLQGIVAPAPSMAGVERV
jgi:muramidase (phage lysozyme)